MSAEALVRWSLALALSGALLAVPESAEAQGKAKERERPELIRRGEARGERDDRRDRYDSRSSAGYGGASRDRSSYERAHEDFHLRHDRECRMRAAERPLDLQWQLRARQECRDAHDEWHARVGRRHG